jgi:hypothetical protein
MAPPRTLDRPEPVSQTGLDRPARVRDEQGAPSSDLPSGPGNLAIGRALQGGPGEGGRARVSPRRGAVDIAALLARRVPRLLPLIPVSSIDELQKRANIRASNAALEGRIAKMSAERPPLDEEYESYSIWQRTRRLDALRAQEKPDPEGADEIWFRTEQVLDDDVFPPLGGAASPEDELRGIILADLLGTPLLTVRIEKRPGSFLEGSGWVDDVDIVWNGRALPNTNGKVTFADLTRGSAAPYSRMYGWVVTGPLADEIRNAIATVNRADADLNALLDAGGEHPYVRRFASTYGGRGLTPDPERDTFGPASNALAAAKRLLDQGSVEDARRQLAYASHLANEALGEAGGFQESMMSGAGRGLMAAQIAEFLAVTAVTEDPWAYTFVSTEQRAIDQYVATGSIDLIDLGRGAAADYVTGRIQGRLQSVAVTRLGVPPGGLVSRVAGAEIGGALSPVHGVVAGSPLPRSTGELMDMISENTLWNLTGSSLSALHGPGPSEQQAPGRRKPTVPPEGGSRQRARVPPPQERAKPGSTAPPSAQPDELAILIGAAMVSPMARTMLELLKPVEPPAPVGRPEGPPKVAVPEIFKPVEQRSILLEHPPGAPHTNIESLRSGLRAEFEPGEGRKPLKHGLSENDLNKEWKAVRDRIALLTRSAANDYVRANVDKVYAAVRSPEQIEAVMVEVWERARRDGVSTTEALLRIARDRPDVTPADAFPELNDLLEGEEGSKEFQQKMRQKLPFIDKEFASDDHLAYTHMFQELVVARVLGSRQEAAKFRQLLADVRPAGDDPAAKPFWSQAWDAIFDSTDIGHVNRPEDLGKLLQKHLGIERTRGGNR